MPDFYLPTSVLQKTTGALFATSVPCRLEEVPGPAVKKFTRIYYREAHGLFTEMSLALTLFHREPIPKPQKPPVTS